MFFYYLQRKSKQIHKQIIKSGRDDRELYRHERGKENYCYKVNNSYEYVNEKIG